MSEKKFRVHLIAVVLEKSETLLKIAIACILKLKKVL